MMGGPVYVRAAGMACPVGMNWPSACAAMRAGITRKALSAYRDDNGREIIASYLRDAIIPENAPVEERWLFLLSRALEDMSHETGGSPLKHMPLFVALPAPSGERPYAVSFLADSLSARLGVRLAPENVFVFSEGAYGGYVALQQGRASVRAGQPCIVAAADSMLSARTLLRLSEKQRLLVEGNSDGVIPGEAAAAMLLTQEKRQALASIRGLGFGKEASLLDNDVPLRAEGVVAAARTALAEAALQLHELDFRLSDAAGESFYFREQALFMSRLLRERKVRFPLWLPAETLGDTGAAAGLCGMLWAMAGWARKYAPGPRAIGFASNEAGRRAAVVFESVA
jgi:3-oxoacyl-[acyl-carrier-protein] synthase-1